MVRTSWPFVEWTEKIVGTDIKRLIVHEEVLVGDDVVRNKGELTDVEIFSSMFRPCALFVKGNKVRGIIAENKEGEYFYHVLFEEVHAREKLELNVTVDGQSTTETLKEDGYYSNFAWNARHIQRIVFPKGWTILSAIPEGYVTESFLGLPSIKWIRKGKFRGDVQVKARKS